MSKPRKSRAEKFRAHWQPYAELLSYLRPYRRRFFVGVGMGVFYALLNGSIPLIVKYVGDQVFPGGANQETIRAAAVSGGGGRIDGVLLACRGSVCACSTISAANCSSASWVRAWRSSTKRGPAASCRAS
jgi:hypothetical protein